MQYRTQRCLGQTEETGDMEKHSKVFFLESGLGRRSISLPVFSVTALHLEMHSAINPIRIIVSFYRRLSSAYTGTFRPYSVRTIQNTVREYTLAREIQSKSFSPYTNGIEWTASASGLLWLNVIAMLPISPPPLAGIQCLKIPL